MFIQTPKVDQIKIQWVTVKMVHKFKKFADKSNEYTKVLDKNLKNYHVQTNLII